MAEIKQNSQNDVAAGVEAAVSRLEMWLQKYQKQLWIGLAIVVAIAALVFLVSKFYVQPNNVEAQDQMAMGQTLLFQDQYKQALEGDSADYIGFAAIADEYSMTASGNLANYYAAVCNLQMGKYEEAIEYAEEFNPKGSVNPTVLKYGILGDCYCELNDLDKALKNYKKAYETENKALAPIYLRKAGNVLEVQKKGEDAVKLYQEIKTKYPNSPESQEADKWIVRAQSAK